MSIDKFSGRSERILKIMKIWIFIFFCWQDKDLSVGKTKICLLARERSFCWRERDLSFSKRETCPLARQREREGPSQPHACELRTQPKIILWVAVRTANSANFSLIKESIIMDCKKTDGGEIRKKMRKKSGNVKKGNSLGKI